ncbi:hypothetical protein ACF0H5_008961 [Mactra antiquata]
MHQYIPILIGWFLKKKSLILSKIISDLIHLYFNTPTDDNDDDDTDGDRDIDDDDDDIDDGDNNSFDDDDDGDDDKYQSNGTHLESTVTYARLLPMLGHPL